jgi:hypothetical protein
MGSFVEEWQINIYRGALIVCTPGTNRVKNLLNFKLSFSCWGPIKVETRGNMPSPFSAALSETQSLTRPQSLALYDGNGLGFWVTGKSCIQDGVHI